MFFCGSAASCAIGNPKKKLKRKHQGMPALASATGTRSIEQCLCRHIEMIKYIEKGYPKDREIELRNPGENEEPPNPLTTRGTSPRACCFLPPSAGTYGSRTPGDKTMGIWEGKNDSTVRVWTQADERRRQWNFFLLVSWTPGGRSQRGRERERRERGEERSLQG